MRKSVALVLATVFVAALAGCSPVPQAAGCVPIIEDGDAAQLVAASGTLGAAPKVSFPTPIIAAKPQNATVVAGDGRELRTGDVVDVQASVYLGETGEFISGTEYKPEAPLRVTVGDKDNKIAEAMQCQRIGSRVATLLTIRDVFGDSPLDPSLEIAADDTVILVTDIERGFLGRANGAPQPLESGLPAVVTAPDGTPGITLPNEDAPTDLRIGHLLRGGGPKIEEGDEVVVHYTGVLWETGEVFDSSWQRGAPASFQVQAMDSSDEGGLVPGVARALLGQPVGSQVVVVVPPEFGYPAGQSPQGVPEGSTMVFVLDVLGIQ